MTVWKNARIIPPPVDRKFLAIINIGQEMILCWSNMDNCFYTSPIGKYKFSIDEIMYWFELPDFPEEML